MLKRCGSVFGLSTLVLVLNGCSLSTTAAPSAESGLSMQGMVHGGQAPIVGSHVYLMEAGTSGYGVASTSLLTSATGNTADSIGYYVTTNSGGFFSITGDYTCDANDQVYIYATGGNSGGNAANSAIGLMSVLGQCPASGPFTFLSSVPFININEVTTVAAAYAMAPFAVDALDVGAPSATTSTHPLAAKAIQNGFANAAQIASVATGIANTTPIGGNGAVPQTKINTIANILASCINSNGSDGNCSTLLNLITNQSGSTAGDTATGAIYLAQNPGMANNADPTAIADLFNIQASIGAPFQPALGSAPNDYTIAIKFTGGGLNAPYGIAIDGAGNAWLTNATGNSVTKLSPTGSVLSGGGSGAYTVGSLNQPQNIAIDATSSHAWITNLNNHTLSGYTISGNSVSIVSGTPFADASQTHPDGIAIDPSGNIWTGDFSGSNIVEFSSAGSLLHSYSSTNSADASLLAIDTTGNVWVADGGGNYITEYPFGSYSSPTDFTTADLVQPFAITLDSASNIWTGDAYSGVGTAPIVEINSSGSEVVAPNNGNMSQAQAMSVDGRGNIWSGLIVNLNEYSPTVNSGTFLSPSNGFLSSYFGSINSMALDLSGDVWVATGSNSSNSAAVEFIGLAAPLVTPVVANIVTGGVYGVPASLP